MKNKFLVAFLSGFITGIISELLQVVLALSNPQNLQFLWGAVYPLPASSAVLLIVALIIFYNFIPTKNSISKAIIFFISISIILGLNQIISAELIKFLISILFGLIEGLIFGVLFMKFLHLKEKII